MKKFAILFATLLVMAVGCKKPEPVKQVSVVGQWQLVSVSTKVTIGSETVDVYIDFAEDGNFSLYQVIGAGRPRLYTGSYTFANPVLSGKYSDGREWGATYDVVVGDDGSLSLKAQGTGETDVYKSVSIPAEIISDALAQ